MGLQILSLRMYMHIKVKILQLFISHNTYTVISNYYHEFVLLDVLRTTENVHCWKKKHKKKKKLMRENVVL